ncbi:hypothetical protein [Marinomonas foliarum]|uniref:Winged helix DNA-binding protein n=1 Tax=Marinomonas foliarum TaxID=491950 RepID=A0A368ZL38_9GAMM|nr:hypothetical protein [Marinomonas foliarum]RCW94158.1 hypothetical protein DFP77_1491 [Marinomonas foliarum]
MNEHKKLMKALQIAQNFGITSINQMIFFLEIAKTKEASLSIFDLASTDEATSAEYKSALGQFRKLSSGSKYRSRDGLGLAEYADLGINRRIRLTAEGKRLLKQLDETIL